MRIVADTKNDMIFVARHAQCIYAELKSEIIIEIFLMYMPCQSTTNKGT